MSEITRLLLFNVCWRYMKISETKFIADT